MRYDFQNIPDGATVILHPAEASPIHREPVQATVHGIYFFCEGTNPERGADYYLGDVAAFCEGWTEVGQ